MKKLIVPDEAVRLQALSVDESFIVQAPAGSGKTGLLIQRFLALLSICKNPEECLAITFTKKAAFEMKERILGALTMAFDPNAPSIDNPYQQKTVELAKAVLARDRLLGWHLVDNPSRLKIQTIDSFCREITQQMPLLSFGGMKPKVTTTPDILYEKAAEALLTALETKEAWSNAVRILVEHVDNHLGLTAQLLANMLSHRDQWLPYIGERFYLTEKKVRLRLEKGLETVVLEALEQVKTEAEKMGVRENELSFLPNEAWADCAQEDLEKWRAIAEFILTQENTVRKTLTHKQGFPALKTVTDPNERLQLKMRKAAAEAFLDSFHHYPAFIEALIKVRSLPKTVYSENEWRVVWALMQLLPVLVAELRVVFQETNTVDFVEVLLEAEKGLGDKEMPSDMALKLDNQLQHILVDEFQDTSLSQCRLLEKITAGWQPDDGRTLFLVGDPMQSIYRFRQAEVGLFIKASQEGINGIPLTPLKLETNFRSDPTLVQWVNNYCEKTFPKKVDITLGAIPFSASLAFKENHLGACAEIITVLKEEQTRKIIALIQNNQCQNPSDRIALLVRSRHHLTEILPALREANIIYEGVELEKLSDETLIQDLVTLTRALLHLGDRIAWLALLRTPWCDFSLSDLWLLANVGENKTIWQGMQSYASITGLSVFAQKRLSQWVPVLEKALTLYQRMPLRDWVFKTWVDLSGAAGVMNTMPKAALAYFDLLETLELEEALDSPARLQMFIEQHYVNLTSAKRDDLNTPQVGLQIMTVHKAKGLEFDTVIVLGMERRTLSDPARLLLWEERLSDREARYLLMAPIKRGQQSDAIYDYLKEQIKTRALYESKRLGYVAATRARQRLYWIQDLKESVE